MLDHLSLPATHLDRSAAFYDAALKPLGYVRVWSFDDAVGYGPAGGGDKLALKAWSGVAPAPNSKLHIALTALSRAAVDAFHAAGLAAGGVDQGAPGLRPHYGAGYYAAFLNDPDGYRLEAVHHG